LEFVGVEDISGVLREALRIDLGSWPERDASLQPYRPLTSGV
jgi:hypothetical protein